VTEKHARSTTGVRLVTPQQLAVWHDKVSQAPAIGVPPPLDWFIVLEAISDTQVNVLHRRPVTVLKLSAKMHSDPNPVYEGQVFKLYGELWAALEFGGALPPSKVGAPTRLYQQARVATFMPYRDGFIKHLEAIPFTAEAAVHGYVRVVLEWARHWRGLTLSTRSERSAAQAFDPPNSPSQRERKNFARRASVALPLVVEQDVRDLLKMVHVEASDVGATQELQWEISVAAEMLLLQLRQAITYIVEDSTLTALTASNILRATANDALGGALFRVRVRNEEVAAIEQRVLEEVRKIMLDPRATRVAEGGFSQALASREHMFAALRVAVSAFAGGTGNDG